MADKLELHGVTLVVGMGKTGLSCLRYLAGLGLPVMATDDRITPPGLGSIREEFPQVPLYCGAFSDEALSLCGQVLASPGVPIEHPYFQKARSMGLPVFGDIELFARAISAPVAAITGSNGKSTVTALLGEMAVSAGKNVRVGANIGTPALDLVAGDEPDLYVLELSSFQLETTFSLNAAVSAILNVSEDHLDRYPAMDSYLRAKERIYRGDGAVVINDDEPLLRGAVLPGRHIIRFASDYSADVGYWIDEDGGRSFLVGRGRRLLGDDELMLKGKHNLMNALAALAMGEALGLDQSAMLAALRRFRGLPHRMEWLGRHAGVDWYNDSKGTNVGATLAAMAGLRGKAVLIAGGLGKGADFAPLGRVVSEHARAVVLLGRDARIIASVIPSEVPVTFVQDMREAVRCAAAQALPGDSVLLSPACASFDMFNSYEHRGEVFREAVMELTS